MYKYLNLKELCDNQKLNDTVIDLLSTDPQTFEFPENLPADYDYKGHYALAITQNFIEVLTNIWEFELIDNPMEA
jgi:hypothetical protein